LSSALVGSSPGFGLFSENVFLTGKVTATSGKIGNWDISGDTLSSVNSDDRGIILDANASTPIIKITNDDSNNRIDIYHTTPSNYGIKGINGGNTIFQLGSTNQIAGWTFTNTTLANGTDIVLDSNNKKITISDTTFGNTGVQLEHNSGTPRAFIGKSTAGFLKFDGTDLEVSSSNFILGTSGSGAGAYVSASNSKLRISSSAFDLDDDGTFNFANGKLTFNGTTLALDGAATIGGNAGSDLQTASDVNSADKTSGTVGGWTITSNELKSNSNKIILHQNNGKNGQIKVGSATSISAGDGIYMDGTGDFRVGDADGERIQFDESESELILSASAFKLGNQTSFVSGSNGNVKISGSSIDFQTPAFVLGDLNKAFISGSNGNLELSASNFILGTSASNAAGGNTGVGAYVSSSNNNLRISSSGFDFNSIGNIGTLDVADGKLTFNGSTLTIDGTVNIGSTAASTIETKANAAQSATDVNTADKDDGTVGGWTISSTEIKSGTNLSLNSSTKAISVNNATFGETGAQLQYNSGTPRFFVGNKTGGFLKFGGSDVEISSSAFILGTSGSGVGAFVSASNNTLEISSSKFFLKHDGSLNIGDDNFTVATNGDVAVAGAITTNGSSVLQAGDLAGFVLAGNNFSKGTNHIKIDSNAKKISIADATFGNTGIQLDYNSGTPRLHAGKSNGERITFDGTNAIISSSAFLMGNNTSFVSGSNGNVKISGSSVDIQTPAFILGDLDSSFVSGSNGNLSMGADTFTLAATGSNDTGIMINSAQATILATGSNSITDANSVILDGGAGVIEVSQSAIGIFDTGRTTLFTKNTVVEPAVFKQGSLPEKEIVSSSADITRPVPTADNLNVISSSKMNRLEAQQIYMDTDSTTSGEGSLTPFFYVDKGLGRYKDTGANSVSSVAFSSQKNLTAQSHTNRSLPPEFIFSAEYFTVPIETPGEFGFVNNSESSGSSIFTITTKVSGSNHTSATGDTNDFTDAKFNILALEADTRGLPNARKSEFTFLQAKASSSIMFQLQHDGDVVSRGNLTAFGTSFLTVSDEREKKNIYQISESLDKVLELRPTKFTWRETDKEDVGFIAQEVEEIIPEVVETTKGFIDIDNEKQPEERKTISYPKLVPYLVDTIKELTKRIEELEKKVK
jgi:hypothetical protein